MGLFTWKVLLVLVLVAGLVEKGNGNAIGDLFGRIIGNNLKDSAGNDCAGCTLVVALLEQMCQVHNSSITEVMEGLCSIFPPFFSAPCYLLTAQYGPAIIKLIENRDTPDVVCQQIGLCQNATCSLFPKPKHQRVPVAFSIEIPKDVAMPEFEWPWQLVGDHLPAVDDDQDKFGVLPTLRGTHWRGKDCSDLLNDIYPGRNVADYGADIDHNCNGISGFQNSTNKAWEDLLCSGTEQFGYILLGDSAGAHFHIPPEWVTAALINNQTFSDIVEIMEDEIDWPEMSSATGYMNETWVGHPNGPVDSMTMRMRARNLCSHRDYQNIGVNGARSSAMKTIATTIARNQKLDHPVMLTYALIGNDVCNPHFGTSHMTTPQEFYANVVSTMEFLDTKLPPGSHVTFMGLVDGRILFDAMGKRIHPIGSLNNDVTYANLYDFLNCLEISPCFGWMNSDEYWRNATTERAMELNVVYQQIIKNHTFVNFDMTYLDCPMNQVVTTWEQMGGEAWQIIEPVDGFHPNQIANALLTEITWANIMANFSYLVPPLNPNNQQIVKEFGQQGGF